MAVTYVKDFTFPSAFGFHKPASSKSNRSLPASKSVPGKAHGGRVTTPQPYKAGGGVGKGGHASTPQRYAKGGWSEHKGVNKASGMGHKEGLHAADKAKGSGDLKRERLSIHAPHASRHEIGPRDAKGAPKVDKRTSFNKGPDGYKEGGQTHPHGCACSMCGGGPARHKEGGSIKTGAGKVKMGEKSSWNKDDAVSPGSFKRTPPGDKMTNKQAANSKFDAEGRNTEPATGQNGNVERMSGWSDFKKGGQVKTEDRFERGARGKVQAPDKQVKGDGKVYDAGGRIKNLGHYAHGGKVGAKYEKAAGTPKTAPGSHSEHRSGSASAKGAKVASKVSAGPKSTAKPRDGAGATRHEVKSGEPKMAKGGPAKRNAAIHAKSRLNMGALASLAGAMGAPHAPQAPGMGVSPPGMAPGMGAPPAAPMGPRAAPPMAGGPPMMSHGGNVKHVIVHHVSHRG